MRCPCKGCTERFEACHDHCEKYQVWKTWHDKIRTDRQLEAECAAGGEGVRKAMRICWKIQKYGGKTN